MNKSEMYSKLVHIVEYIIQNVADPLHHIFILGRPDVRDLPLSASGANNNMPYCHQNWTNQ
jgi:hypothetical protein